MKDGKVFIWMNLLGFERCDRDRGVKRFLKQTGFTPDGVCALVSHPDFFHQHKGMEEEYTLHPDNCAYWGIPRNYERERQPWTNYDLRRLCKNLKKRGIDTYASIFGVYVNNAFHKEWADEHPEIRRHGVKGECGEATIFVLKRFKDGTYYEDFFINKVCETLTDYGMKGVHLADFLCPPSSRMLYELDFSTDFVEQFTAHSGVRLPEELTAGLGTDTAETETARSAWIYKNVRAEWIEFVAWRWEVFFKKLADRLHAIDKKLMVLGMYCTDPFETLYCLGVDLRRIVKAGVDYISANILPASCFVAGRDERPDFFHKYMALASTTAAHLPKGHLISMLGIQDATEEWSTMHHAPSRHERDIYAMMAYHMIDRDGPSRALDGYFLTLGDGICREDWDWERTRLEGAMTANAEEVVSPAMLWSEAAHEAMTAEYIKSRRWTPHKHFYELSRLGIMCGATVTPDGLKHHTGALLVPNFDMLPENERKAVLDYKAGAVVCTSAGDFSPSANGITPTFETLDAFSNHPMRVFLLNRELSSKERAELAELAAHDDGCEDYAAGDLSDIPEYDYVLNETLKFAKVTEGYAMALARLLALASDMPFEIDRPNIILKQRDGAYRLYLFNDSDIKYHRAFVKAKHNIKDTKTVTRFPILPPKWMDEASAELHYIYKDGAQPAKRSFQIKIQPAGVTVVDVYFE